MITNDFNPQDLAAARHQFMEKRYYSELAKLTTGLFIGVLALMTFLLTVGLQHPQKLFSYFCYAALIILPLNLVVYAVTNLLAMTDMGRSGKVAADAPADKKDDSKADDKSDSKPKAVKAKSGQMMAWVKALRLTQQLLFILSLIAVTGFGLVAAHIFFAPPQAAPQQVQGQ